MLGCTHYSLITDLITEIAGNKVGIIDTGFAVAKELQRRLQEMNLQNTKRNSSVSFFSSGNTAEQETLISHYWGKPTQVMSAF